MGNGVAAIYQRRLSMADHDAIVFGLDFAKHLTERVIDGCYLLLRANQFAKMCIQMHDAAV